MKDFKEVINEVKNDFEKGYTNANGELQSIITLHDYNNAKETSIILTVTHEKDGLEESEEFYSILIEMIDNFDFEILYQDCTETISIEQLEKLLTDVIGNKISI